MRRNKFLYSLIILYCVALIDTQVAKAQQNKEQIYRLVWADEFNGSGKVNPNDWNFEKGFARNEEDQWYQEENAYIKDGFLVIEARKEQRANPTYEKGSSHWAQSRKDVQYTSSSINTMGKHSWRYGRFEMRARIPVGSGLWPAFWTLGIDKEWPSNGEIDIMEYYKGNILANIAVGTGRRWQAEWHNSVKSVEELGGKAWAEQFHIWRMDWDEEEIALYVDDALMIKMPQSKLFNKDGTNFYPFKQPHYMLLNFALGGMNGGEIDDSLLPAKYEIDYVRVYQKEDVNQRQIQQFAPGKHWVDQYGDHINAHGGGILFHEGIYYWYGENRKGKNSEGVNVYTSKDLTNWNYEGVVLSLSSDDDSPISRGCIIERPKVIYNEKTKQFVMYFHLELKGRGYEAAQVGVAVSDNPTESFKLVKASRVNPGKWPLNMTEEQRTSKVSTADHPKWWTPAWHKAVEGGLFVRRDYTGGQMSRDMTLYVDDDHKAYHIYSAEDNLTIHIAELTTDYLGYTGRYTRVAPAGHNEAPALFKKDGKYYMITSGCTGWEPNAARLLIADDIMGEWTSFSNPCVGKGAHMTFGSQGTYILPIQGKKDAFIFMADRWLPKDLTDSRYIWLPIEFKGGMPTIYWKDTWSLDVFN